MNSAARVRVDNLGIITVETDMTDIGTGSYTIIDQTAAEMMGARLDQVIVRLGDSAFPVSSGSGGQWGANSATAGVYAACVKLREAVAQKVGFNSSDTVFEDGQVRSGNRTCRLPRLGAATASRWRMRLNLATLQALSAVDFWRTFCRSRSGCRNRRDPPAADTGGVRRRPHPQSQISAQPSDRRDDYRRVRSRRRR
jgi:CO/xanthine dehydrogenase Mo-binding subunit